jgi:uncharacterized protein (DUF58 family)
LALSEHPRTGGSTVAGGVGVLAVGVLAAAWAVGATALAILGFGLALAAILARGWTWAGSRSLSVERLPPVAPTVEGEPLALEVVVRGRPWLASRIELRDRIGPLGEQQIALGRNDAAAVVVERAPRGRYALGPGTLLVDDPLGLSRLELPVPAAGAVLVRPRIPHLGLLFSDAGSRGDGGRRQPVRRPSGLEPHGVREYVEGEPLRAVHWATSARRGQLMVRELEDAPRDSVAVLLDVERSSIAGPPGDSSLDDAVRAAAGLVRAHAARSRGAMLVIGTPAPEVHRVRTLGSEWERALDALAGVEGADGTPLAALVAPRGLLATIAELVVVTARPEQIADALIARAVGGRIPALVAVDAPTYAGRPATGSTNALLRLAGTGAPVAVLRHGVPLEDSLAGLEERAVG